MSVYCRQRMLELLVRLFLAW